MGLKGKKMVVAVTGSIASYKSAEIVSQLVQKGADVTCMMSSGAMEFITPLTFQTLTGKRTLYREFDLELYEDETHIKLAKATELFLIAPATANIIGKLACGIADDLVSTFALAVTCPIVLAPAMNVNMYKNKIVQQNMEKLRSVGMRFIEPGEGFLACGDVGLGRLREPEEIVRYIEKLK
jgi:phosphopantothenoylcysteine decarboxylase/phosphopantothenate--cysteine ligase